MINIINDAAGVLSHSVLTSDQERRDRRISSSCSEADLETVLTPETVAGTDQSKSSM